MGAPNKLTPHWLKRLKALRESGLSLERTAAALHAEGGPRLTKQGVDNALRGGRKRVVREEEGDGGEDGAEQGAGAAEEGAEGEDGYGIGDEDVAAALKDVELSASEAELALPEDASVAARAVAEDLREIRQVARVMGGLLKKGKVSVAAYTSLKSNSLRYYKTLHELLPPPKPDPEKDPTNIAAREMVHAHLLHAIQEAEARRGRLCPRCMKDHEHG